MSKKIVPLLKKGRIELYSIMNDYVASRAYWNPKDRTEIIDKWKKRYPNKQFHVVIKPEVD